MTRAHCYSVSQDTRNVSIAPVADFQNTKIVLILLSVFKSIANVELVAGDAES